MEIEITAFVKTGPDFFSMAGSVSELGCNAAKITWQACQAAPTKFVFLDNPEKLTAARNWFANMGAWTIDELNIWTDHQVNSLFLQYVAGDFREMGICDYADITKMDWSAVEALQNAGAYPSNIFKTETDEFYFTFG